MSNIGASLAVKAIAKFWQSPILHNVCQICNINKMHIMITELFQEKIQWSKIDMGIVTPKGHENQWSNVFKKKKAFWAVVNPKMTLALTKWL